MNEKYFYHPSWPVLYEDNHLLGLYKPAGLLVQGDQTGEASLLDLAKAWLKQRYGKPGKVFLGLVHRLDRPVAGVVLLCRTSKAAARLSEQFRSGTVRKTYLAVVEGRMVEESGYLVQHIERREELSSRIVKAPTSHSQEARLSFQRLDLTPSRSLVQIRLETGRKHQIRLQLSHLGYPVLGDLRYGASAPLPQRQIALMARELMFEHPTLKETLTLTAPLPVGWPWPETALDAPRCPWSWSELAPLACSEGAPSNPCPFAESVEE